MEGKWHVGFVFLCFFTATAGRQQKQLLLYWLEIWANSYCEHTVGPLEGRKGFLSKIQQPPISITSIWHLERALCTSPKADNRGSALGMAAAAWAWRNTKPNNDITRRNRGSPSWICCNNKPLTHRTSSWSALFSSFQPALAYFLCQNIFSFYFRQLPFCYPITAACTLCGVGKTIKALQINQAVSSVHPFIFWSSIWQRDWKSLLKLSWSSWLPFSRQKADVLFSLQTWPTSTNLFLGTMMFCTLQNSVQ